MSNFANAKICLDKVFSAEGCQYLWVELLLKDIAAGVTYESLQVTREQIEKRCVEICLEHAKLWYKVVRADRKHNYDVTGEISHMKKWLAKGGLPYSRLGATAEEIELFIKIAPEFCVQP